MRVAPFYSVENAGWGGIRIQANRSCLWGARWFFFSPVFPSREEKLISSGVIPSVPFGFYHLQFGLPLLASDILFKSVSHLADPNRVSKHIYIRFSRWLG